MLPANCEYSRSNREKLPLPIQIKLSKKTKTFCHIFLTFVVSIANFQYPDQKTNLGAQVFLKLFIPKNVLI